MFRHMCSRIKMEATFHTSLPLKRGPGLFPFNVLGSLALLTNQQTGVIAS